MVNSDNFEAKVAKVYEARGTSPACVLEQAQQRLALVIAAMEAGAPIEDEELVTALIEVDGLVGAVKDAIAKGEDAAREANADATKATVAVRAVAPAKGRRRQA